MNKKKALLWGILLILGVFGIFGQKRSSYLADKIGTFTFYNNTAYGGEFERQVRLIACGMQQKIPAMSALKGFDLLATVFGKWDQAYRKRSDSYGRRCEIRYDFQLFVRDQGKEGKWTVEPPFWALSLNDIEGGHEGGFIVNDRYFIAFPMVREVRPGVRIYGTNENLHLVIYNPKRPEFWIRPSVKEVVGATLAMYQAQAADKDLYQAIRPLVEGMGEEELSAPACYGSEDGLLKVNGQDQGLPIMRFNPEYWDKTLTPDAIQLITIHYRPCAQSDLDEYMEKHGRTNFLMLISNQLDPAGLLDFLQMK